MFWSAPEATPAALLDLAGRLGEALAECGFVAERRTFHAHVTLARRAAGRHSARAHAPICWPVDGFCLVISDTRPEGVRYKVLRRWRLLG